MQMRYAFEFPINHIERTILSDAMNSNWLKYVPKFNIGKSDKTDLIENIPYIYLIRKELIFIKFPRISQSPQKIPTQIPSQNLYR